jgi:hypothetical protein
MTEQAKPKPQVKLIGADGNAYNLLGLARRAATKAGWSTEQWNAVCEEAKSGDYDHLLRTLMKHFEVV